MPLETELIARLRLHCPRVHTPAAPFSTERPYVTWQHVGGRALRWAENTAPDIRNAQIQVNVWADTKMQALTILRAIEEELCNMTPVKFTATPMEAPVDAFVQSEDIAATAGVLQTFSIWGER